MRFYDEREEEAARIYAAGMELIRQGDGTLAEAFRAPQSDNETLLEVLLLQRQAIAKQREGLALIDLATEMRCEIIRTRQRQQPQQQQSVAAYPSDY